MSSKWPMVLLGDVLNLKIDSIKVEPNVYYKISGIYSFGRGLLAREPLLGAETTYKVFHRLHENDFVISHLKAWEGAIARVTAPFDGWFLSPQFSTFLPDPERLEISYLEWYCKQSKVWEELRNKSRGMGARRDSVSPSQFLALSIPLPPLEEQRRIVARIEELAARIEEARELRRRAVEEADIFLYSAARKIRLDLSESEIVKPIGDITIVTSGGTPERSNPLFYDNGTIPWIKTGELIDKDIWSSEEKITEAGLNNSSAKLFPVDTILVALYGQGQTRGRTGILKVPATTNQACAAILPKPEVFDSMYLQYWLRSLYHEMRLQNRDGAQPNWNGNMIKKIKIALPSIEEQRRIVAHLDALQSNLDALRGHQSETAAALEALLPAVLERALRGEL